MRRLYSILTLALVTMCALADDALLTGTPIGSSPSVDYSNSSYPATTSANLPADAFDGDMSTFYASYERSFTYVGLDLGTPHIITRVGWSPRNDGNGPRRNKLAIFEGANRSDFADALPLYIITENGVIGQMSYADVTCSKGFRYVRYVGPSDARCNVAELEFYGHAGAGDNSQLYRPSGLPVVVITTVNAEEPTTKDYELAGMVSIIGEDNSLLQDTAYTRLRGNASKDFPKKPYRIKFQSKHRVLDAPAKAKKWTLINNYGDKTLMRNLIAFRTSHLLGMPYTPYGRPVDVILNGEYKGAYQLCDQIEVRKNRVDIEEITPQDDAAPNLNGGYLIEVDAYAYNEPYMGYFYSDYYNPVTIKAPSSDSITYTQYDYIQSVFNTMESAVYGTGWRNYLDESTFLRHFLVGELSGNTDTYWSMYMYKRRNDPLLYSGPVWDFDLAYENDDRTYPIMTKCGNRYVYASYGSYAGDMRNFINRIINNDTQAQTKMEEIWSYARNNGLTADNLCAYIDSLAAAMDRSQELNFMRWNILNTRVHQNPTTYGSYAGEVNNVKTYIRNRIQWMDNKVGYTPGPPSALDNIADDGIIRVWNIQGILLYEGPDYPILTSGLYIIQHNGTTEKTIIK